MDTQMEKHKTTHHVKDIGIDNYDDFRNALANAQFRIKSGVSDHIEVSERLFRELVSGQETPYLTYGDPGIKIYIKGTKSSIDTLEKMSAQEHYEHTMKEMKKLG